MTSGRPVVRAAAIWVTKPGRLRLARRIVVVIVEPRLPDRHDLRMLGEPDKLFGRHVEFLVRVVRMRSDRAVDVVEALGDRPHPVEPADPRADGHHRRHARRVGAARRPDRARRRNRENRGGNGCRRACSLFARQPSAAGRARSYRLERRQVNRATAARSRRSATADADLRRTSGDRPQKFTKMAMFPTIEAIGFSESNCSAIRFGTVLRPAIRGSCARSATKTVSDDAHSKPSAASKRCRRSSMSSPARSS